jgi:ADP-ribose pyrophosphatase
VALDDDLTDRSSMGGGFVNLRRLSLVAHYPTGEKSNPFRYDMATRDALDAAVIAAHFIRNGERWVILRSALRPPAALRSDAAEIGTHKGMVVGNQWEVAAGLVEPGESPRACAVRELHEELGAMVKEADLRDLGPPTFPSGGLLAERHVFFHVEVDPSGLVAPSLDGSPLEHGAAVINAPLSVALAACQAGEIVDAKTELALRRLAEHL